MTDSRRTRTLILLSLLSVAGGCSDAAPSALTGDSSGTVVQTDAPSRTSEAGGPSGSLVSVSEPRDRSAPLDGTAGSAGTDRPGSSSTSPAAGTGGNAGSAGKAGRGGSGGATPAQMQPELPPADDEDDDVDEEEDDDD